MGKFLFVAIYGLFCGGLEAGGDPAVIYRLSTNKPTVVYPISQAKKVDPRRKKFIQVRISKVTNPSMIPLAFTVYYKPVTGKKTYLGAFALFPADNPGTFIVATQGKLQKRGRVIISLIPLLERRDIPKGRFSVEIDSIKFVDQTE